MGEIKIKNTNPEKEILRMKLLNNIENKVKNMYKINNLSMSCLYLDNNNKNNDPILCELSTKNSSKKQIYESINIETQKLLIF